MFKCKINLWGCINQRYKAIYNLRPIFLPGRRFAAPCRDRWCRMTASGRVYFFPHPGSGHSNVRWRPWGHDDSKWRVTSNLRFICFPQPGQTLVSDMTAVVEARLSLFVGFCSCSGGAINISAVGDCPSSFFLSICGIDEKVEVERWSLTCCWRTMFSEWP